MTNEGAQPGIRIIQVFLEHAHFSHREGHLALPHTTAPITGEIEVQFEVGVSPDESRAMVRVRVMTQPESGDLYAFDVCMVALLRRDDESPNMSLATYVGTVGATLIYPFMREAVANITTRGRFGPVWLAPFNVKAVLEGPDLEKPQRSLRSKGRKQGLSAGKRSVKKRTTKDDS